MADPLPQGKATLRLAFCDSRAGCNVEVFLIDESVGGTGTLPSTSAMQRDGICASWVEHFVSFDTSKLNKGVNVIKLKSYTNTWSQGVVCDVVRLELDETSGR